MTDALKAPDTSLDALMGAIVDEFLGQVEAGERPEVEAYAQRFPELATVLRQMLPALSLLRASSRSPADVGKSPDEGEIHPEGPLGDFRIIRELGRGGMGVVYEAMQVSLGRRVALKVLPFAAALDSKQLQRFKNEAQAAAQLHHQNIVPIYGVGMERGVHYYAMQFIEGHTLASLIAELRQLSGLKESEAQVSAAPGWPARQNDMSGGEATGPYAPSPTDRSRLTATTSAVAALSTERSVRNKAFFHTAAQLGIQAAQALEHAHELGIVHRDIKPANLLVDVRGNLWITDFGLAHCQSQAGLTMSGDLLGTLRYMSPEQALAKRVNIDQRTDVYSLGVTFYELLTLEPAFPGRDRQELLRQIAFEEPKAPRRLNHAVPPELETIVLKAIAKNPSERYATAGELADDLHRFLEDKPIKARRPTLAQRGAKWARRNQPVVWSVGVSAIALMLLTLIGLVVNNLRIADKQREVNRANENLKAANAVKDDELYFHSIALAERELASNHAARASKLLDSCWPKQPEKRGWEWHFLKRRIHEEPLLLTGPSLNIVSVAYSPNGRVLASAGWDGKVVLWDTATGKAFRTFPGEPLGFYAVAFSPDNQLLAAANWGDGTVTVWDLAGDHKRVAKGHFDRAYSVSFSPDGRHLAASSNRKVIVWDLRTDEKIDLCSHDEDINCVAYSPDGTRLATASDDHTVRVWDARTGQSLLTLAGHRGGVASVVYSHDGRYLASASGDRTARIWDPKTGALVGVLTGHRGEVQAVTYSPDGRRLASAGQDGTVRFWDPETGQEALTLRGHKPGVSGLAFGVSGLAFSPDGSRLATACLDNAIRIWNATPVSDEVPEPLRTIPGSGQAFTCLAFSRDGLLAAGSSDNTIRVTSAATGETIHTLRSGQIRGITSVAFSPDGANLAAVGDNGGMWNVRIGQELWPPTIRISPYSLTGVAYSPDGRQLAVADLGAFAVRILDAATGKELYRLNGQIGAVNAVAYHPDGQRLAVAYYDQTVRVWDLGSQKQLQTLRGHDGPVTSVAYDFDGRHLVSADHEGLVILWRGRDLQ